ncbi:hypothetical protein [Rurimicrobium arvi]|uniref:Peptidoglycan binding-like domain-containing protein n=1 Tax=Rurimicrobium arvi TaxID=2049916 RepID=A0ABP8MYT6_9BACT
MEAANKSPKKENVVLYIVYATAAYFGLQLIFKPKRAAGATLVTTPTKLAAESKTDVNSGSSTDTISYQPSDAGTSKKVPKQAVTWIGEQFPLQKGMKGERIKTFQKKLGISSDGKFGTDTENAVYSRYGTKVVSQVLYQQIVTPTSSASAFSKLVDAFTKPQVLLQAGSKGEDVYRLQKWLGFKDKGAAKRGEPVADRIFGNQTLAALKKRTGKASITLSELNQYTGQISGIVNGEQWLVTTRPAMVLDSNLRPYREVPASTILGVRMLEFIDPGQQKAYMQFRTVDGFARWVEKDAV